MSSYLDYRNNLRQMGRAAEQRARAWGLNPNYAKVGALTMGSGYQFDPILWEGAKRFQRANPQAYSQQSQEALQNRLINRGYVPTLDNPEQFVKAKDIGGKLVKLPTDYDERSSKRDYRDSALEQIRKTREARLAKSGLMLAAMGG